MKHGFTYAALVALFAIALGACGSSGPDFVAMCNKECDKTAMCSNGTVTADQCKANADCAHFTMSACTNNNAIADCINACFPTDCTMYQTCLMMCPMCTM